MGVGQGVTAARQVIATLPGVMADPYDLQLRRELSMAALQAGLACSQMRYGQIHERARAASPTAQLQHSLAARPETLGHAFAFDSARLLPESARVFLAAEVLTS